MLDVKDRPLAGWIPHYRSVANDVASLAANFANADVLSYTTTDALIDDYFAGHPEQLPAEMTVSDLHEASDVLITDESRALNSLVADLSADLSIPLTGYVELNEAAQAKLGDARELSSEARNRITVMPYKLMLPMLARRVVCKSLSMQDPEFRVASHCEMQSIPVALGVNTAD